MFLRVEKTPLRFATGTVAVGDSAEIPDEELSAPWVRNLLAKKLVTSHARNPAKPAKHSIPTTVRTPSPVTPEAPVKVADEKKQDELHGKPGSAPTGRKTRKKSKTK